MTQSGAIRPELCFAVCGLHSATGGVRWAARDLHSALRSTGWLGATGRVVQSWDKELEKVCKNKTQ